MHVLKTSTLDEMDEIRHENKFVNLCFPLEQDYTKGESVIF